jgi:hypothetical protein
LKKFTRAKVWSDVETLEGAVFEWLEQQPKEWYEKGIAMCVERWQKAVKAKGDYFE